MNKTIYNFQDYKAYLQSYIRSQPMAGRGFKARIADAMECQRGFVTKILSPGSSADLSLEQAEKLNPLLAHSSDEAHFFLLLVQFARAGTAGLKEYFRNQMKAVLNRRFEAEKERQSRAVLSAEDHMRYYSVWYYAAIRVAVSIPAFQTKESLSRKFDLPLAAVTSALEFLVSRNLIVRKGDRFINSEQQQIFLSSDHPMVNRSHVNWRTQVLKSLDKQMPQDLHYSYLVTLSESDAFKIRSFLVETIQEVLKRAAPSKEEVIYSICLDYFEL